MAIETVKQKGDEQDDPKVTDEVTPKPKEGLILMSQTLCFMVLMYFMWAQIR